MTFYNFYNMDALKIKITDHISLNKGITPDEAEPLYEIEKEAFGAGRTVVLDFEGVEMLTTAFLNVMIGNLYKDYNSTELKSMLKFEHLDETTAIRIKKVTTNAKAFYNNEKGYSKIIEEVIRES